MNGINITRADESSRDYTTTQVANAIGMTSDNLRKRFVGYHLDHFGDDQPEPGLARKYSLAETLTLALARNLMECGFSPYQAYSAAHHGFMDTNGEQRAQGQLFPEEMGHTFFVVHPQLKDVEGQCYSERELNEVISGGGIRHPFLAPGNLRDRDGLDADGYAEQIIIIDLTRLQARVVAALESGSEAA